MENKELSTATGELADLQRIARMFAASGFFSDAKDVAQAAVKIMAGKEIGLPPLASMTGVYLVKGRVSLSANLMASALKRAGYRYQVKQLDNTGCAIEFFSPEKESLGVSSFTESDAKQAGLFGSGDNWKKYPRNMYFARAMSNGVKWFCPDVFGGPVYTPDELGAAVNGETGEVLVSPSPAPQSATTDATAALNAKLAEKKQLPSPAPLFEFVEEEKALAAVQGDEPDLYGEEELKLAR